MWQVIEDAGPVVAGLVTFTVVLLAVGGIAYATLGPTWLPEQVGWPTIPAAFVSLAGLLFAAGRYAYRQSNLIRLAGILWDVGTFWPRATHPLAPSCYAEQAIPDLLERIQWLAPNDNDVVTIVAQDQSSIIAAALFLQLDPADRRRVRVRAEDVQTEGHDSDPFSGYLRSVKQSSIERLYARCFPAYVGPTALQRIRHAQDGGALSL